MKKEKTSTVVFYIKDPDQWGQLIGELDLDTRMIDKFFEFAEYATVQLTFDESLNVVKGCLLRA